MLTKKSVYVEIVYVYLLKFNILFQGKSCKDKIYAGKTPRSVSLRGVESDSVQC